jgi:hypothetical protein
MKWVKPDELELYITLKNDTGHDIYLPTLGPAEPNNIKTLWVYQWNATQGWRPLGSGSELPPDAAIRLAPGQSRSLVSLIMDPTITPGPGEAIPVFRGQPVTLRGIHRVTVGFYQSEQAWQAYRKYVESLSHKRMGTQKASVPPQLELVDSEEFKITAPSTPR